jgi:hypothetical protein
MVDRYRQAYLTSTRKDKAAITRRIVQELKSTGARFLRRFNDDENRDDKKWVEVDDKTAYNKVGHALRLRKTDDGHQRHNLVNSRHHGQQQQQPLDNNSHSSLHSTTARITETGGTSQNVAAMPIGDPQNPLMQHSVGLAPSPSLAMHHLPLQLSLPSPLENQLQMATYSQSHQLSTQQPYVGPASHQPNIGTQPLSILPLSIGSGHGNLVIDPQLFSRVFTSTLALMTQSILQHQHHQQQQPSLFNNNASSSDLQKNRSNQKNLPNAERGGNR